MATQTMYDAVVAANIPTSAQVAAGYVDGDYANFDAVVARTPRAQHVSITVKGKPGAMVADVEMGDLTPAQGRAWALAELAAGRRPTLYMSRSTYEAGRGQWPPVDFWIADWTGSPHLVPGSVATQYAANVAGCDLSLTNGVWPSQFVPPAPSPHKPQEDPVLVIETPTKTYLVIGSGKVYLPTASLGGALVAKGVPLLTPADGVTDAWAATIPDA